MFIQGLVQVGQIWRLFRVLRFVEGFGFRCETLQMVENVFKTI
jgi:hypothetical protein